MRAWLSVAFLLLAGGGHAEAIGPNCVELVSDEARLACYDARARAHRGADAPSEPVAAADARHVSRWALERVTDPLDDSETVSITLEAESGRSRWGKPISLGLRCRAGQAEVHLIWHDYLGIDHGSIRDGWKGITVRIGTAPPEAQHWLTAPDRKSAFAPVPARGIMSRLLTADRLVVRALSYGSETPTTAIFDLNGLADAIHPLEESCGSLHGVMAADPERRVPPAG